MSPTPQPPQGPEQSIWGGQTFAPPPIPSPEGMPPPPGMPDESANPPADASPSGLPPAIGTPDRDAAVWDGAQSYPDTCAIRCQEFILEQFTGQEVDEDALIQQALDMGLYRPGEGTSPEQVGGLLEANGIAVNQYTDATIYHLTNELAQGHKVIVGLDSGELWDRNSILDSIADRLGFGAADHAVVVSGIDTSDPDNIKVQVSDPGTGEAITAYPLEQFVDAWKDSDFYMVATQDPAPPELPEMVNFDYAQGHIDQVWDMPYPQFAAMAGETEAWDEALAATVDDPPASRIELDDNPADDRADDILAAEAAEPGADYDDEDQAADPEDAADSSPDSET